MKFFPHTVHRSRLTLPPRFPPALPALRYQHADPKHSKPIIDTVSPGVSRRDQPHPCSRPVLEPATLLLTGSPFPFTSFLSHSPALKCSLPFPYKSLLFTTFSPPLLFPLLSSSLLHPDQLTWSLFNLVHLSDPFGFICTFIAQPIETWDFITTKPRPRPRRSLC